MLDVLLIVLLMVEEVKKIKDYRIHSGPVCLSFEKKKKIKDFQEGRRTWETE